MLKWTAIGVLFLMTLGQARSQCFTSADDLSQVGDTNLDGITDFSLDLMQELYPHNSTDNFFYSPMSIWNVLSLAYFGAEGNTFTQLQQALRVGDKVATLKSWRALEFLYTMRQKNNTAYTFNVANRAYFDESVPLRNCVKAYLHNELETIDLRNTTEAVDTINDFVSNTTKGRIPVLVTPDDLVNANMVLANAAFFKGTWLFQFKKQATKKDIFYTARDQLTMVDMMTQKGNFRVGTSEELGARIIELPYTGESISMFILLPPFIAGENGFSAMIERLNATTLRNAMDSMWRVEIEVTLPKMKLEITLGDELITGLSNMGITDLFDPSSADLSAFSPEVNLFVGKTIHKAAVEVTEEGTEAAAATGFISFRVARPIGPEKFLCNHPFLFFIHDNLTKNILFLGAYKNPKA